MRRWLTRLSDKSGLGEAKSLCSKGIFLPGSLTPGAAATYSAAKWVKVGWNGRPAHRRADVFRGANKVTLDAKGRVAMPARYRDTLVERSEGRLVATVDRSDRCLLIYPLPDWEEIERKLMRLPTLNGQARRLQRLMVGHATDLELDSHGRVLIPPKLREYASLTRQAMLIGQGSRFELWDEQHWNERREAWLAAGEEAGDLPTELVQLSL